MEGHLAAGAHTVPVLHPDGGTFPKEFFGILGHGLQGILDAVELRLQAAVRVTQHGQRQGQPAAGSGSEKRAHEVLATESYNG